MTSWKIKFMALEPSTFPAINATLNGLTAILIVTGRGLIARKKIAAHRACMVAAVASSSLFLTSYLYYHLHFHLITRFQGTGWARVAYFLMLGTHTVLAAVIVPMVLVTLTRGLRARYDQHRRIARWTFPIWLYVSVTGVLIYFMLYHWFAV